MFHHPRFIQKYLTDWSDYRLFLVHPEEAVFQQIGGLD